MIRMLLKDIERDVSDLEVKNLRPSQQVNNYCYLIAGIELLLSCPYFLFFILYYIHLDKLKYILEITRRQEDITPMCLSLAHYVETKNANEYAAMEHILMNSFDVRERGHQEDSNILFLYFSKSYLFRLLFSWHYGSLTTKILVAPFSIHLILPKEVPERFRTVEEVMRTLMISDIPELYAITVLCGNHYEVYQGKKMLPKNTRYLRGPWRQLTIFARSYVDGRPEFIQEILQVIFQ